jgi:hypothetical protein
LEGRVTANQAFSIVNMIALAAWILLALMPRRRWVGTLTGSAVPVLLAIVYVVVIVTHIKGSPGGFSSLPDVAALFQNPWLLLAGWTHYLVFDLLIGNWEVRDAQSHGLSYLVVVPCLALTFLFGPAGWLLYVALRTGLARRSTYAPRAN